MIDPPVREFPCWDLVQCEFPLPDPDLQRAAFRTKSLACRLERYTITKDGRLIRHAAWRFEHQGCPEY